MKLPARVLRLAAVASTVATITALVAGSGQGGVSAQTAPEDTIEALFAAIEGGRTDDVLALVAEDVIWADTAEHRFEAVGRPAFAWTADRAAAENTTFTIVDATTEGSTVTGVVELRSDLSEEAGLDGYRADLEAVLYGQLVGELRLSFDLSDAETATFVNALDPQRGIDAEGAPAQFTLAAAGTGTQSGLVSLVDAADEVVGVEVAVEPGMGLQRTRIYSGMCAAPGDPAYWLADIRRGSSFTLLSSYPPQAPDLDVSDLVGVGLILGIGATADSSSPLSACGALGAAPPAATPVVTPAATPTAVGGVTPPAAGTGHGGGASPAPMIVLLVLVAAAFCGAGLITMGRRG